MFIVACYISLLWLFITALTLTGVASNTGDPGKNPQGGGVLISDFRLGWQK